LSFRYGLEGTFEDGRLSSAHRALALASLHSPGPPEVPILTKVIVIALTIFVGPIRRSFLIVLLKITLHVFDHVVNVVGDHFLDPVIVCRLILILKENFNVLLVLLYYLLRCFNLLNWLRAGRAGLDSSRLRLNNLNLLGVNRLRRLLASM